jgi:hypothetical protein
MKPLRSVDLTTMTRAQPPLSAAMSAPSRRAVVAEAAVAIVWPTRVMEIRRRFDPGDAVNWQAFRDRTAARFSRT